MQCEIELHERDEIFSSENSPPRRQQKLDCNAADCHFIGKSLSDLKNHWLNKHEEHVLLFLCPFPGCQQKHQKKMQMNRHFRFQHKEYEQLFGKVPVLAEHVRNLFFRPPRTNPNFNVERRQVPEGSWDWARKEEAEEEIMILIATKDE